MHSVPIAATKVVSSNPIHGGGRRGRERMVPGITTIYDISTVLGSWIYNYLCNQYLSPLNL
jgi:hypothetical protein